MPTNHTFHLIRHFQSSFKLRHYRKTWSVDLSRNDSAISLWSRIPAMKEADDEGLKRRIRPYPLVRWTERDDEFRASGDGSAFRGDRFPMLLQ